MDTRLKLMFGAVGLIVAVIVYGRWRSQINHGIVSALKWIWKIVRDPKTCKVAETFFLEAAVLWFVFPLLDSMYGPQKLSDPLLRQSYFAAGLFFFFAIILSHAGKEE